MSLLQLETISEAAVESVKASFNDLPHTAHADGMYRLRRYSVVRVEDGRGHWYIERRPQRSFNQSAEYNKFQGDIDRAFEDIEDDVITSQGMREICQTFKKANELPDKQKIEVHQMRVVTQDDGVASVAPEGVHQDGYDCIAIVGINRHNIEGGELLVSEEKDAKPFLKRGLSDGEIIMLDDSRFWHNASDIKAADKAQKGYGDWFILCALRAPHNEYEVLNAER